MAAPTYAYKFADLKTGYLLAEYPLSGVTFTSKMLPLGVGTFTASLPVGSLSSQQKADVIFNTEGSAVELMIERNRVPIWTGILTSRAYDSTTQSYTLSGRESWSYFDRRLIEWDLTYAAVDQGLILQDILQRAALEPDGDIRLDLPTTAQLTLGVLRDRSYLASDCKPVSATCEELAAVANGFEFAVSGYWSKDASGLSVLRHLLAIGKPLLGDAGVTGLRWEIPGVVTDYSWQENMGGLVNEVFAAGDDGTGKIRISRSKLLPGRYPLLQSAASFRAITQLTTLKASGDAEVARLVKGEILPLVAVAGDHSPELGSFHLGDVGTFNFADPRFAGVPSQWRLAGWTVLAPGPSQSESVALILVAP